MRYSYYAKSSKYLFIGSVALFISKLITIVSSLMPNQSMSTAKFFSNITEVSFYGFLILAFVALNSEATAHKRSRQFSSRKSVKHLKRLIVYCFLSAFVKAFLYAIAKNVGETGFFAVTVRVICAAMLSAASLSFVLFAVSLWYIKRDGTQKKLLPVEAVAVFAAVLYYVPKFITSLNEYSVTVFSEAVYNVVCSPTVLNILCLVQYAADAVMFFAVKAYYDELTAEDDVLIAKSQETMRKCDTIFESCGYGIDSFDRLYTQNYVVINPEENKTESVYEE